MEVRPGYKQTEVGAIPEEWDCERVRDAAANSANAIVGGPFGSDLVSVDYSAAGVPVIRGQNMSESSISGDFVFVSPKKAKSLSANLAHPGDLVFTQRGTLGQVSIVPGGSFDCYLVSQSQMKVSLNRARHDPRFVHQYFESRAGQKQIVLSAIQTGVPHTNLGILRAYQFPAPPLPEQRAIATALSDVDALLGGLDRLIAKKRDLKRAAMQQLLTGQTRLPGFDGKWEETTLGQIGECIIGLTYKPENVVEHGLLVLRSSNVQNGRLAFENNVHVNLEVSEHLYVRPGDILVCVRNGSRALIGKSAVIVESTARVTFGAFMSVFRTKHWRFIAHAFQSNDIQRQVRDNIGATINQITNKDMNAFRVRLPPPDEQTAIAAVLSDMDAELSALEARRDKTRALKQGMMLELLTGRTRLTRHEHEKAARC